MSLLTHPPRPRRKIGYARETADSVSTEAQVRELRAAGCVIVHEATELDDPVEAQALQLIDAVTAGDIIIVTRLDRIAKSTAHLLEIIDRLEARGAFFRSLSDPIDTSTKDGQFAREVLSAACRLERSALSERIKLGMKAAIGRGRPPGSPGLREQRSDAIKRASEAKHKNYISELVASSPAWLPVVQRMRPQHNWDDIARILNQEGQAWTAEKLRRAVHSLVEEAIAESALIRRAPRRPPEDRLLTLVAGIAVANPSLSLAQIAGKLDELGAPPPRRRRQWPPSSVRALLDRARELGLSVPDVSD